MTLVVANLTVAAPELVERLKALAEEGEPRRFIVVVPQSGGRAIACARRASARRRLLASLDDAGIVAAGMIGDPDPYTAIMNAVQYFHIAEIVISTLPEGSSQWIADKLVDRVRDATQPARSSTSSPARPSRRRRRWRRRAPGHRPRTTTSITTGRPRPTAPRASSPRSSGCCFSSSRRS